MGGRRALARQLGTEAARCETLLYLDGDVTAQKPATGMVDLKPKLSFDIGTWYKTNQALYGSLDELRLLDRAMSAEEIAKRMEQTSGEKR